MLPVQILAGLLLLLVSICGFAQPFGFAINSDAVDTSIPADSLLRVNLASGAAVRIGPTGFQDIEGLAFDGNSQLFGVDDQSNTLLRIDTFTGAGIPVDNKTNNLGLPGNTAFDFGLSFVCGSADPLISSDTTNQLLRADMANGGQATLLGSTDNPITGLAAAVIDGEFRLYGLGAGNISPALYRIDADTGATTLIGPLGPSAASYSDAGLDFDAEGKLWAITDRTGNGDQNFPSQILRIDITTGTARLVAETTNGIESLAITSLDCSGITGVSPEPPEGGDQEPEGGDQEPEGVPALKAPALLLLLLALLLLAARKLSRSSVRP